MKLSWDRKWQQRTLLHIYVFDLQVKRVKLRITNGGILSLLLQLTETVRAKVESLSVFRHAIFSSSV